MNNNLSMMELAIESAKNAVNAYRLGHFTREQMLMMVQVCMAARPECHCTLKTDNVNDIWLYGLFKNICDLETFIEMVDCEIEKKSLISNRVA